MQGEGFWERWAEIDDLFERLLSVEPGRREAQLRRLSGGDADLERTLRSLLVASDVDGGIVAGPTSEFVEAALDDRGPREALPDRVGAYRVIRRLGRGGMGSVFLAERDDPSFRNLVAVKLLRRGVDTEDVLIRFRAERQILASLHHPGIATVFEAGTSEDGRPFLVMEYVEGRPLTRHCDAERLDVPQRLRLFLAVLRAVSHAHTHGVVHRDLKPSNIFVTREEAHVKLLDFGIAKLLDSPDTKDGTPPTHPDSRPMTPGFASPEQILGLPITKASDIYQLGLLLHELLTGTRPIADHAAGARLDIVDPDLPSRTLRGQRRTLPMRGVADARDLARILAGDLDAIVLRCLQPNPSARYDSVDALHEDIVRYLDGQTVAARRATRFSRVGKLIRRRVRVLTFPAVVVLAVGASWLMFRGPLSGARSGHSVRWVATGPIVDGTDHGVPRVGRQVGELLATNLARADELQIVRLPVAEGDPAIEPAALQAGAAEVITGVVQTLASGELELVLQRLDTGSGSVIDSIRVRGSDTFALVDRASAALLSQYGVSAPHLTVARVSTTSPQAYSFFIEGLTAFGTGDDRVADRFFHAALEEDSTFALATYYASRTTYAEHPHAGVQLLNRAYRLAEHASERERLVIRARWAAVMDDPRLGTYADSLVQRFPAEAEGHYLQGVALRYAGRFPEAIESLQRAVALDSLSLHATLKGPCVACDALEHIVSSYLLADSMEAAVRAGKRWTNLQPGSARAWHSLASALLDIESYDAALDAQRRAAGLRAGNRADQLFPGMVDIHRGNFEDGDRLFRLYLRTGTPRMRIQAAHWLAISLRMQGRWGEALKAAEALLDAARPRPSWDQLEILGHVAQALALLGSGRADEAAPIFEASARVYPEFSESRKARVEAWALTHAGTARAVAGDTTALKVLIERVDVAGTRSNYARDKRLHHYLRALLARARGAPEAEVEAQLRAALYSLSQGYSRINLELAESLLRQRRYEEAAAVAAAPLRNSMESNGMYATRTDFHALLGRIWYAAGEPDSARVHLRAARYAWRAADPIMALRVAEVDSLLAMLK